MEMNCIFFEEKTEFTYLIHIDLRIQSVNGVQMNAFAPANSIYKLGCNSTQNAQHKKGLHTMLMFLMYCPGYILLFAAIKLHLTCSILVGQWILFGILEGGGVEKKSFE
jgi:hypothetical protein